MLPDELRANATSKDSEITKNPQDIIAKMEANDECDVPKELRAIFGKLSMLREMDADDESAVVDTLKQKSAFSPNYIHSLDSAHMMQTAVACRRRGLVFAAVHDSFWTHPSDVDQMNVLLRDEFVALHSEHLLEQLSASFRRDFPEVAWDSDPALALPRMGDLDLEEVKKSTYFFA